MPGSATLGTNLVDSLITDVVDGLRDALHPDFGVRQFRVFTVVRTFDDPDGLSGTFADVESELRPQPLVIPMTGRQGAHTEMRLEPCGIDEAGIVVLREVSLTYTEAELSGIFGTGASLADNQEWLYKIVDAQGQEISDSYWKLARRPFPDRIEDIGWVVELRRAQD